jgi:hypothetical protein
MAVPRPKVSFTYQDSKTVGVLQLGGRDFEGVATFGQGQALTSALLEDLSLSVDEVF